MEKEAQSKVFEAFTQADTSTTRQYGGTGLGLAISKHYVELMQGNITVTSELGAGTCITINLPLPKSNSVVPVKRGLRGATAILLCDDQGTKDMVSSHLRLLGAKTSVTENASDLNREFGPAEFIIIDHEFLINQPSTIKLVNELTERRVLILTPLTGSPIMPEIDGLKCITKPITVSSIYDGASGFVSLSKSHNKISEIHEPERSHSHGRILVAEDVETNQKIAAEMLELLDYEIDIAENGYIAVEKFKLGSYSMIFMDCQMPVMDGFAATLEIRNFENKNKLSNIPIVALTAGISKEDRERCISVGMDGYLSKPFSISELSNSIRSFEHRISKAVSITSPVDDRIKQMNELGQNETNVNSDIFNIRAINNIREVEAQTGKILLPSILEGFKSQMQKKLVEIVTNLNDSDLEQLYRTAHAIKSMSANIGAERVRTISAEIEISGRNGVTVGVENLLLELSKAYDEFIEEFQSNFISEPNQILEVY
jgi:CheY-like chemotaxis protein